MTKQGLIASLIHNGYLKSPRIIEAFRVIDRMDFILEEYKNEAYGNYPLPIGEGQTISQPLTVAFLLELLDPQRGEKVLDIGSGSGWTTALLAYLVSQEGIRDPKSPTPPKQPLRLRRPGEIRNQGGVFALERIEKLCNFGEENVKKYNFVERGIAKFYCKDGTEGLVEEAPFDKILTGAAASRNIPQAWRDQLKIGGKIVAPVDQSVWLFIKKGPNEWEEKEFSGFAFVPLVPGVAKEVKNEEPRRSRPKKIKLLFLLPGLILLPLSIVLNEIYLPHTYFEGSKTVEIPSGTGSRKIGELLKKNGFIRSKWAFVLYTTLRKSASLLKPGTYTFNSYDNIPRISKELLSGSANEVTIVIPEGWTLNEIAGLLEKEGVVGGEEFKRMAGLPAVDYRRAKDLPALIDFSQKFDFLKDKPSFIGLEGYLFPDTYRFFKNSRVEDIIPKMLSNFDGKLTQEFRSEITKQKKGIFEVVTVASLVEKEVSHKEDRRIVSGILWKRLEIGMPLQIDATITYITGRKSTKISLDETQIDSPYNTYKYKGVPLGPIANPGLDAIKATVNPQNSPYLYYLSTTDGKTIFSKTLAEHNKAKAKYLTK